ncbi:MAG: type II and III secretion system protein family protein [Vulcanimicrobiaceae bacterium]
MIKRTPSLLAVLIAGSVAVVGTAHAARAAETTIVSIESGHSTTLEAPGLSRVAVGDADVAGVVPIGTSQVVINAKKAGHTTVIVWAAGHERQYEVDVSEQGVDDLVKLLRTAIDTQLGRPGIQVMSSGGNVIVRGSVDSPQEFDRVAAVIAQFSGYKFTGKNASGQFLIANLIKVAHPLGDLEKQIEAMPGGNTVHLDQDKAGDLIVTGHVHDRTGAEKVLAAARGLSTAYLSPTGKVIDRLTTDTQTQVNIKVYVLEVDETAQSALGLRLNSAQPNDPVNPTTYTIGGPTFSAIDKIGNNLLPGAFIRTYRLAPTLDLLLQNGHARMLSSPDLTTTPGEEATFLVGGEVPYPFAAGNGQIAIVFQKFGVQLDVKPTLLGDGSIESKIVPEVSELDFAHGIQINGFTVPALQTSKLSTDVITKAGESIVMGGLLKRINQKTIQKIPLLGDIPILGKLFRSTNYTSEKTDVVFVMTPELITR